MAGPWIEHRPSVVLVTEYSVIYCTDTRFVTFRELSDFVPDIIGSPLLSASPLPSETLDKVLEFHLITLSNAETWEVRGAFPGRRNDRNTRDNLTLRTDRLQAFNFIWSPEKAWPLGNLRSAMVHEAQETHENGDLHKSDRDALEPEVPHEWSSAQVLLVLIRCTAC